MMETTSKTDGGDNKQCDSTVNENNKRQRTGQGPSPGLASAASTFASWPSTQSRGQGRRRVWARDRLLAMEEHLAESILNDLSRLTEGARMRLLQIKQV